MKKVFIIVSLFLIPFAVKAQERIINNHFFLNPYVYNPAFAGHEGRASVSLNHRQQWRGINGAPVTSLVTFDLPLRDQFNFGLKIINDSKSILSSTTVFLSLGYTNKFSRDGMHQLSFGLSAGAMKQSIKTDESIDFSDPDIIDLFNNRNHLLSELGVYYKYYRLKLGVSLPALLDPGYAAKDVGFSPLNEILILGSYGVNLVGENLVFEPHLLYSIRQNLPSQFEGTGIFRIFNAFWIGGSYRQHYGSSALAGLHLGKSLKLGYAYEFSVAKSDFYPGGFHEFQVSFGFGDRNKQPKRKMPRFRY